MQITPIIPTPSLIFKSVGVDGVLVASRFGLSGRFSYTLVKVALHVFIMEFWINDVVTIVDHDDHGVFQLPCRRGGDGTIGRE